MATMTVTSTYAGDALKKYILACILGGETLATQGLSVQTNVKYKRKLSPYEYQLKRLGINKEIK